MYLPQLLERKYGPNWEAFVDEALEAADAGYDGGSGCEAGGRGLGRVGCTSSFPCRLTESLPREV